MSLSFNAESLVSLNRVSALVARPDGQASVAVVERLDMDKSKYVSDLWLVPHDGGPARQLTRGETKDRAPAFLADGTLLFLSDRPVLGASVSPWAALAGAKPGDEARAQIWALPTQGEAFVLSDEPHGVSDFKHGGTTVVALVEVLPGVPLDEQKKRLADKKKHGPSILKYTAQPVRFWDRWLGPTEPRLVAYDLVAGVLEGRRELTADAGDALRENSWDLSADGRQLAITWAVMSPVDRIHDKPLALIGTQSGARTLLGSDPNLVHAAPRFVPGGNTLVSQRYRRSRDGYAQRSLWRYDLPDGGARELTPDWDRWPGAWGVLADGVTVVTTAEDLGKSPLFLVDLETGAHRAAGPTDHGSWDQVALVPGGNALVGVRSDLLAPPEPFWLDLTTNELRPLARLSGFTPPAPMPTTRVLDVAVGARADGTARTLSTLVVEPHASQSNGRTVLWIHGGPVAAWSEHWHWRWSSLLMAEAGYRVVLPNPSGSTGHGIDWVNDIWGNTWGERCYDDLMRLIAQLESEGTRAREMVIMGGSFGGYMTNWIGTHGERFRALVTHASLFDMGAFHGVTDFPSWWELMLAGAPWSDPEFDRYSPARFVSGWRTPTLILHGDKDFRVPVGEGLALFEALQAHGVPSELAIFPDEHHWILKPNNVIAWYETVLDFLDRVFAEGS